MDAYAKTGEEFDRLSATANSDAGVRSSPINDIDLSPPLLCSYDRQELKARVSIQLEIERRRNLESIARERKAFADSLVDQFELTGSDLPADANPRQLHLF